MRRAKQCEHPNLREWSAFPIGRDTWGTRDFVCSMTLLQQRKRKGKLAGPGPGRGAGLRSPRAAEPGGIEFLTGAMTHSLVVSAKKR